jgi:hypothetical protein
MDINEYNIHDKDNVYKISGHDMNKVIAMIKLLKLRYPSKEWDAPLQGFIEATPVEHSTDIQNKFNDPSVTLEELLSEVGLYLESDRRKK